MWGKKWLLFPMVGIMLAVILFFPGCGGTDEIMVVSREEGSGTRACFEELVMGKDGSVITDKAILQSSNGAVRTAVAGNEAAIGYLSLGYVDESVKALAIDGVACNAENCRDGSYPVVRSLNFVTNGDPSGLVAHFIHFCQSAEGQEIVAAEGYISMAPKPWDAPATLSGDITEAGSTTVQPLAEKLAARFMEKYPEVSITIQGGGSSVGVKSAGNGTVDIGAASRELKSSELEKYPDLKTHVIARDGVAVVAHPDNDITGLTKDEVGGIFAGNITEWSAIS